MEEKKSWNQFAASGRVLDYLEYRGCLDGLANATNVVPAPGMMSGGVIAHDEESRRENSGMGEKRRTLCTEEENVGRAR